MKNKNLLSLLLFGWLAIVSALAQTITPNIGLQIPPQGSNDWNLPLNYNFTRLDSLLSGGTPLPQLNVVGPAYMTGLNTWSAAVTYSAGQLVFVQGIAYLSTTNGNFNHQPPNGSYWTTTIGGGSGGASFPGTNGLVFNTSTVASRNATSSDIIGVLGFPPAPAANPVFTGTVQINGAVSGAASLSATATGGGLNLGSTNATVTSSGALTVASCSGCIALNVFTITASPTPAINLTNGQLQTITITSATAPTVTGISAGSHLAMQICQGSTVYAWTWPAAFRDGICIGPSCFPAPSLPNTCSMQTFNSFTGSTLVPENVGVINVAP